MKLINPPYEPGIARALAETAELLKNTELLLRPRGIDPEQSLCAQAERACGIETWQAEKANLRYAPPKFNAVFGESPAGQYFRRHLAEPLAVSRIFTSAFPPDGFMGWHTDIDEPGYYIMFSWVGGWGSSFYYIDNDQRIELDETPGWNIKLGVMGSEQQPFWHATRTPVAKFTFICYWDTPAQWQAAQQRIIKAKSNDHLALVLGLYDSEEQSIGRLQLLTDQRG